MDELSNTRIEDAGEKFEGARKDAASPIFNQPFKLEKNDSKITKKKIWPSPNFREDVHNGIKTKEHALLFMLVYEGLCNKPLNGGWFNISGQSFEKAYEDTLNFLKEAYEKKSYENRDVLVQDFNDFMKAKYSGNELYAAGRRKGRVVQHPLYFNLHSRIRFKNLLNIGWPHKLILDSDCFGAYEFSDNDSKNLFWYAIEGIKERRIRSLDNWAKHDHYEAALQVAKSAFRSIIQKRKEEQPENNSKVRSKPPKRPTFNRPFVRVGETYRQSNISTEEFLSTFKFRGIEWGNYVTQSERQGFLDATYDSFIDLTRLCGLPPSFASLGGKLGIAFGSRGRGYDGAAAHFELDQWLIHLTKTKGVGALAHEFGHALDAYLALKSKTKRDFLTESFITKYNNHSLSLNTNSLKVSESESLRCFKVLLENMIFTSDKNIIDEDQVRINSTFAKNACLLDQGRKEAYWTDPTELFARVFEVWVSDKLKASGYINEFLVYGPDEPPSSWHTKVNTYPEDQERIRIVHYLDRWLSELVTT